MAFRLTTEQVVSVVWVHFKYVLTQAGHLHVEDEILMTSQTNQPPRRSFILPSSALRIEMGMKCPGRSRTSHAARQTRRS